MLDEKTNALVKEFWDIYTLEEIKSRKEKTFTTKWVKEQKKRESFSNPTEMKIDFTMHSNTGEMKAVYLPFERSYIHKNQKISEAEFFKELFSDLKQPTKEKYLSLLEMAMGELEMEEIFQPLHNALIEPKEKNAVIDWELYSRVRRFWHLAEIQSSTTKVKTNYEENWRRDAHTTNAKFPKVTKSTKFEFDWAGEQYVGVLEYKEIDESGRKSIYAYRMKLNGGEQKLDKTLLQLLEKLPQEQQVEFSCIKEYKNLQLNQVISLLLPISNILESL